MRGSQMDSSPRFEFLIRHCANRFTDGTMQNGITPQPRRNDFANSVCSNNSLRIQKGRQNRNGVMQGGPVSPTLFNIFIDTPATELESHLGNGFIQMPAYLYADDVILHVENMTDLQCELIVCENWAQRVGMTWALSKGKSQVVLSRRMKARYKHFPFAGGVFETVTEA